ncbi:integration host factor subunit beta [Alkanindiges sp. WGS2144]|uniref:integration host factor subunit beta n=1 Tax=Alkanindiges sp. WGS2144 TaxID=3366808 RepID=UPI00375073F8
MTNNALNKSDLIERIAGKQTNISENIVEDAVKTILDQMISTLATNNRIEIRGFGSFALHHREPRVGRNPKTGDSVKVAAKAVPHFKPGKALRDAVNEAVNAK